MHKYNLYGIYNKRKKNFKKFSFANHPVLWDAQYHGAVQYRGGYHEYRGEIF